MMQSQLAGTRIDSLEWKRANAPTHPVKKRDRCNLKIALARIGIIIFCIAAWFGIAHLLIWCLNTGLAPR